MTKPKNKKYMVLYMSTEAIEVEASSEEKAIEKAQNTEASEFSLINNDWVVEK